MFTVSKAEVALFKVGVDLKGLYGAMLNDTFLKWNQGQNGKIIAPP